MTKYKSEVIEIPQKFEDTMTNQEFKRSPKGLTIFTFDNPNEVIGTKILRKGKKSETIYKMFKGTFSMYDSKSMFGSNHILELPIKSCGHQLMSLILDKKANINKKIKVKFQVDKSFKNYDVSLLEFSIV